MATDIDVMYDVDIGFAESCTGPAGAFLGIFDNEYYEAVAGSDIVVSASTPELRVRDADTVAVDGAVTVRSTNYVVVEVLPDGNGETILRPQIAPAPASGPTQASSSIVASSSSPASSAP